MSALRDLLTRIRAVLLPNDPTDRLNALLLADAVGRLDDAVPHWRKLVNVDYLDMASGYDCVLGQVFGTYGHGLDVIFGDHHRASIWYHAFSSTFPVELWLAELRPKTLAAFVRECSRQPSV